MTTIDHSQNMDPADDVGGCDGRYRAAGNVWGCEPDAALLELDARGQIRARRVLDAGCGDGRNAAWLARAGARVVATDVSELALDAARRTHGDVVGITWHAVDLRSGRLEPRSFGGVVSASVLHWLRDESEIAIVFDRLVDAVETGGWLMLTVFSDRYQYARTTADTRLPCLLPHDWFADRLGRADWHVLDNTDSDLAHAHTGHEEFHTHAVTTLVAERLA